MRNLLLTLFFFTFGYGLFSQENQSGSSYIPKLMPAIGHTGFVTSAKFSPDGQYVLTASADQTAKIWAVKTGKLIHDLKGHTARIGTAQYSPDGQYILTGSRDKTAKIWSAKTGKLIHDLIGHTGWVSAQYSPDGQYVLTASKDKTAKIWSAKTGKLIRDLIGHTGLVRSAKYSPDEKYILTASFDSTAKIWSTETGQLVHDLKGHTGSVHTAQYSPDGQHILTGSRDKTAKIWSAKTGKLIHDLKGHMGSVSSAQYSPDGQHVLSASSDSTAKVWSTETGQLIHDLKGHTAPVYSAQYSPDGRHILTTGRDNTAKVWSAKTGQLIRDIRSHTGVFHTAQYSPDGQHILTTGFALQTAKIWSAETGQLIQEFKGNISGISSVQYSPDEQYILTVQTLQETARIWSAKTGQLIHDLKGHTDLVTSAQFSPDGQYVLTASFDSTAKIWSTETGQLVHDLKGHTGFIFSAQFSPDGQYVLTASMDSTAKIWSAKTGESIHDLSGHTAEINSAQYSSDGKQVVTRGEDQTVKIWSTETGKLIHDLAGHTGFIFTAQFSPDGQHILTASSDKTAKIWSAKTGNLIRDLAGHTAGVYSAQYSPDGQHILTASSDKTAKIWSAATGKLIHDLKGHTAYVTSLQYRSDGKQIVTTSQDQTVKIWSTETGKLIHDLTGHTSSVTTAIYSADGQHILSASMDGSIRLWKASTGKALMSILALRSFNWIVLHTTGLFDASPKAMEWMYYVVGQEVIELEQLKERYYEPGLYQKVKQGETLRNVEKFKSLDMYPKMKPQIKKDELKIKLKKRNGGMGNTSIFINNKEVLADVNPDRDSVITVDLQSFEKYYLHDTVNYIGIRTSNAGNWLKSPLFTLEYTPDFIKSKGQTGVSPLVALEKYNPHFYAIIVGTSDYNGTQLDLRYADKDSKDIANAVKQTAIQLFGEDRVHLEWFSTDTLSDSKLADKENIKKAFESLSEKAKPGDVLNIYFSGHGTTFGGTENEQFYYLTKDVYSGNLTDPAIRENYAISTEELTQWVTAIPAQKQVLILDACASGKVVEDLLAVRDVPSSQIRALDRMKDRTGMFVLAGSAADKVSYEASQFGQGLLTYSLLLGMSGGALGTGGNIDVMNLFQFARNNVPEFAKDIGGIQTPTLASPKDASSFDIGLVTDAVKIPLQEVKPVFIRSVMEEDASWSDIIGLSSALDEYMLDVSAGAQSRGIIFVDANRHKNAYMVRGRYTLSGQQVTLRARIFKGTAPQGEFQLEGDKDDLQKMVERILDEVNEILEE